MKRFFIIHGWSGYPEECWFMWLKKELEKKGFEAYVPQMPNAGEPKIEEWVSFLSELVENPDGETYFVAHSIGCQTVMRYLERLPEEKKIGGTLFVGGWFNLIEETSYDVEEDREVARPWIETPIDFEKVRIRTDNILAIFSDNDQFVPLSDSDLFKQRLNAKIIILNNKKHMGADAGLTEFPEVLDNLMEMIE